MTLNIRSTIVSIIKASLFVAPNDYGLSRDEILEVAGPRGFLPGEVTDELEEETFYTFDGRYKLGHICSIDLLNFSQRPEPGDPRNIDAFQFIGDQFDRIRREKGKRHTQIRREELTDLGCAAGISRFDLDVTLTICLEFRLLRADGDGIRPNGDHFRMNPQEQLAASHGQGIQFHGIVPNHYCAEFSDHVRRVIEKRRSSVITAIDNATVTSAGPYRVGERLGQYLIEAELGVGAMGCVFRAQHDISGRKVAIKFMHPHIAITPPFGERFKREALAATRLDHPNCVRAYEHGHAKNGQPYMVMEYVEGEDLGKTIRSIGHSDGFYHIFFQILSGLEHAHGRSIIHRDLKPTNILLSGETVRIVDFGLVKLIGDSSLTLTGTGQVMGTPKYMSPEQARGHKVDLRADLYAVGLMMYEAVVGEAPFTASDRDEMLRMHMVVAPPALPPSTPASVIEIVTTLLQKDPAQRYSTATEALLALNRAFPTE